MDLIYNAGRLFMGCDEGGSIPIEFIAGYCGVVEETQCGGGY